MKHEDIAIKPYLIEKLKQEHCLWSYENDSVLDVPDDVLVELVMLYLDIDEINLLFRLFDYKTVKRAWIENVVAQGERYYNLNYFFAWYYFHAKQPRRYVKAMATRQLNKRLAVGASSHLPPIQDELSRPGVVWSASYKTEAMMRRSKFRDYYDIYSILKSGIDIHRLIPMALEHSGHRLKTKGLMAMLTNGDLFRKDEQFGQLQPVYDVSARDIEEYLKSLLL